MQAAPKFHLPDFCRWQRLLALGVLAMAVVAVPALAPGARWGLTGFAVASAFAGWIALTSGVLLCRFRRALDALPNGLAWLAALAVPMLVAGVAAVLVRYIGGTFPMPDLPAVQTDAQFVPRVVAVTGLVAALALRYFGVQERWAEQVQDLAQARADALQARIRPHFLFNSMNTIAALIRVRPAQAEAAVEDLADLFRAALGSDSAPSTLGDELLLVERFVAIEKLRLGERLQVRDERAENLPMDLPMPRLILQPLWENAIVHGIAPRPEGGEIAQHLKVVDGHLRLELRNPLPANAPIDNGNHHAQGSVASRLRHQFGEQVRFEAGIVAGHYQVRLEIPLP